MRLTLTTDEYLAQARGKEKQRLEKLRKRGLLAVVYESEYQSARRTLCCGAELRVGGRVFRA